MLWFWAGFPESVKHLVFNLQDILFSTCKHFGRQNLIKKHNGFVTCLGHVFNMCTHILAEGAFTYFAFGEHVLNMFCVFSYICWVAFGDVFWTCRDTALPHPTLRITTQIQRIGTVAVPRRAPNYFVFAHMRCQQPRVDGLLLLLRLECSCLGPRARLPDTPLWN